MKAARESLVLLFVAFSLLRLDAAAQTVSISDPNLETAIRAALFMPTGGITRSNLEQLISLSACGANVTNFSGLQWATNLTSLDLSLNLIRELTPLSGLVKLTNLNVGGNLITNLNPLSGLTKLDSLWLFRNPLPGLAPVTNLTRLTSLVLYGSQLENLSPLAGLTNLRYLELRWNPLTNAQTVLPGLTNLTALYLGGTSVSNVNFLQNLKRLTFLNLDHNQIRDLSPLTALPALSGLDVSYNPLTNTAQLSPLTNLTSLCLSGNSISNVAALSNMVRLTTVTLFENQISDLSPLTGLTNLTELGLSRNPILNFAPLAGLTNLTALWLDGTSISNLDFVPGLKSLKAIGLRQNRVSDLGALNGLTNLLAVFGDYNRLTDIGVLQNLPRLSRTHLTGNLLDLSAGSPASLAIQILQNHGASVTYLPQDVGPSIAAPLFWNIAINTTSSLNFQVADDATIGNQLSVTASSANPGLIPDQTISTAVLGNNGILTVTPAPNQSGTASITLTVTDHAGLNAAVDVQVNVVVPQAVTIPDANLRATIRQLLNKTNTLTTLDLERVTQVVIDDKPVATLAGLEWATNLVMLVLNGTATTNLSALQNLRRLSYVEIEDNGITDMTPLAGLSSLTGLSLEGNSISNLNFLQNLTGLIYLSLDENGISDLSPLSGLTNLDNLSMGDNLITDLLPIKDLPRLTLVDVRWNLLSATNPVLQSLDNRDVEVKFLPQRGPPEFDSPKIWVMDSFVTSQLYFNVEPNGFSGALLVAAKSSNTNLLPNGNLLISDSGGGWWSLSMTGRSNLTGSSTVTLFATNDLGFSDHWDITVTVAAPLTFDGQVVNPGFTWLTGANGPWSGQTAVSHDGYSSATSGTIEDGEQSWLEATLQGPGVLSFWWRVSSEINEDWLELYVDGVLKPPRISGEVDWQQRQVTIPTFGTHKARWQFTKDFRCCSDGEDAAWVDQVTYVPLSWLEAGRPTNGQCPLVLHLAVGHYYEVQTSSNMFNWSRLAFLVPTNSTMPFLVSAASDWRFYRLRDYAPESIRLDQPRRIGNQIRMDLLSPTGLRFEIQASTNMVSWSALTILTNTLGSIPFTNTVPANAPVRFYRAKLLLP